MKSSTLLVVLANIVSTSNAHWIYPALSVNDGALSKSWQYIRRLGPAPPPYATPDNPSRAWPHTGMFTDEIRCGREAFASAKTTETLMVQAGDEITFFSAANFEGEFGGRENYTQRMYHPGAAQIYLSLAPNGDLENYAGDGDWFKIKNIGTSDGKTWDLFNKSQLSATIPKTTPPGKYLLKVEYIAYHNALRVHGFEFYLSCAHIDVKGPGGGNPGPMVKFPGAYDSFDRSIWRPHSMTYWGEIPGENYTNPGPAVWMG